MSEINDIEYLRDWLEKGGRELLTREDKTYILKYADHFVNHGAQFPTDSPLLLEQFYFETDLMVWKPFVTLFLFVDSVHSVEKHLENTFWAIMKLARLVKDYFSTHREFNAENSWVHHVLCGQNSYMVIAMPMLALLEGMRSERFQFTRSLVENYDEMELMFSMAHNFLEKHKHINLGSGRNKREELITNLEDALYSFFDRVDCKDALTKFDGRRYSNVITDWCEKSHQSPKSRIPVSALSHPLFFRWGIAPTFPKRDTLLVICGDCASSFLICHIHKTYVKQQTLFSKLWTHLGGF